MAWPGRIKDAGGIRNQFHHVIDIVPTILEATGIPAPATVDGIAQKPIEGVSMAYTLDKANANAPSRAQDAVLRDVRQPRHLPRRLDRQHRADQPAVGARRHAADRTWSTAYTWELYDLTKDWTQDNDLAAANPGEAEGDAGAVPGGGAPSTRSSRWTIRWRTRMVTPRPSLTAGRTEFTYSGR